MVWTSRNNMFQGQPREKRLLKHVLSMSEELQGASIMAQSQGGRGSQKGE